MRKTLLSSLSVLFVGLSGFSSLETFAKVKQIAKNPPNSVKQQEIYDCIFKIKGCSRRTPSLVKCEFTVTNRGKETRFKIVNNYFDANKNSRMVDSSGRVQPVTSIEFGGFKSDNYIDITMFNGIDYKLSLDFKDISDDVSQIPFLRLVVQDARNSEFFVDFRAVNISSTRSQESCVLNDSGKLVCEKPQNGINSSSSVKQQEIYDYIFDINGCRRRKLNLVMCEFTITNRGKDSLFTIVDNYFDDNRNSRMVDSSGRIRPVSKIDVNGAKKDETNLRNLTGFDFALSRGINFKPLLYFDNISDEISQIPLLRLVIKDNRNSEFFVDFRNIDISSTRAIQLNERIKPGEFVKLYYGRNYTLPIIYIYCKPSKDSCPYSNHQGMYGDRLIVLGSTKSQDGYIWYNLKYPDSSRQGWVREEFIFEDN